jgi:protein-S-isoprenylcysteine O-methyltransferase Ste14
MSAFALVVSYVAVIILTRVLTMWGRPRRTLGEIFRTLLDPTFHVLAWTSLAAIAAPLLEYLIFRPGQLLALNLAGAALIALSGALAFEANRALGAAFTPFVDARAADKAIVTAGPYRSIRHPLYTAGFLLTTGAPLMLCCRVSWLFSALCWFAVAVRTFREERLLKKNMPGYADYMKRTKRFVPGLL